MGRNHADGKGRLGGRPKGAPNKKTAELQEIFRTLKYDPAKSLFKLLPQLDSEKQADVHLKLMEYIYPKRKAVEMSGPDGEAIGVTSAENQELVDGFKKMLSGYANERNQK